MAVYDAAHGCIFTGRKILFDTNVYIFVDGFDTRAESQVYSRYYWQAVNEKKNEIIINDYVLSEFFNRTCRDQHNLEAAQESEATRLSYKRRRQTPDFIQYMETIRDSCLHFLAEAKFEHACHVNTDISALLHKAAEGRLDFADVMIMNACLPDNCILVTDDADYVKCGFDIVTANRKALADAKKLGILAQSS